MGNDIEPSQPLEGIPSVVSAITTLAAVAGAVGLVRALLLPTQRSKQMLQIEGLEHRYGQWAVRLARAVCPTGDAACIEREARRLHESRLARLR